MMCPVFVERLPKSHARSMNTQRGKSNAIYSEWNVGTQVSLGDYRAGVQLPGNQGPCTGQAPRLRRCSVAEPGTDS